MTSSVMIVIVMYSYCIGSGICLSLWKIIHSILLLFEIIIVKICFNVIGQDVLIELNMFYFRRGRKLKYIPASRRRTYDN